MSGAGLTVPEGDLPLAGVRVVEIAHMVMGPTCGMILADLGADVVKIEPAGEGDATRRLTGSGAGYFAAYNRNKRSVALDIRSDAGREAALRLVDRADVFSENFRPGAMDRAGFGWEALSARNPGLVHVSHKGFLDGPYQERTALDEVVQMMAGLAWMTGPPGRPLRAGASVNDVMGGMFGAIGALAALRKREVTGRGEQVASGLFENCAFLVAQHIAQAAVSGQPLQPMSVRTPAWGVYDIFTARDGAQIFAAVVSEPQWAAFCAAFGASDLATDPALSTNTARVAARERLIPDVAARLAAFDGDVLCAKLGAAGLPWAAVASPEALADDAHLRASGGLVEVSVADGRAVGLPALPLGFGGRRLGMRRDAPTVGGDGREVLAEAGFDPGEIAALERAGVLTVSDRRR